MRIVDLRLIPSRLGLVTLALAAVSAGTSVAGDRPNILLAIADDWGWPHAGAYGDPVVKTPAFDQLAESGVLFTRAFISSPSCTPSRAAILTGQYHWRLEESANLYGALQAKFPTYPELLAQAGYHVGLQGKGWGPGKVAAGGRKENAAGRRYASFARFLDSCPQDAPFCFWFGSSDPHRGYQEGSGRDSGMDLSKIQLPACFPDSDVIRSDVADYYWEVQRFDRDVAKLMDELKRRRLLDNTLVVVTGDHGMPFPRCKGNLYDTGARVPLVCHAPKLFGGGRRLDDFVSLIDLAPTFLELAGVDIPSQVTGRSLAGRLTGKDNDATRTFVLAGKERHVPAQEAPDSGGTPMRSIRTDDHLLIVNYRTDRWPAGTPHFERAFIPGAWYGDVDNGPTKTYMVDHRDQDQTHRTLFDLAFAKRPEIELYDLEHDPDQLTNLAGDPKYEKVVRKLMRQLTEQLRLAGDPRAVGEGEQFDSYPYDGSAPKKPGFVQRRD